MRPARAVTARPGPTVALVLALVAGLSVVLAGSARAALPGADATPTRPATADADWAAVEAASIHPGVQMYTEDGQCTANFVFTDRRDRVYVGYAAHCASTGTAGQTNGCRVGSHPLGTRVRFAKGGTLLGDGTTVGRGRLVYSSWLAMQEVGTTDAAACAFNDFALVRVARADRGKVNPSVPFWGGPVGLRRDGTEPGETVHSYGSSSLRAGGSALAPKQGTSLGTAGGGWTHLVYTVTPGVPGDSGSGYLDAEGRAVGVLSTLVLAPEVGANGVGDLQQELRFARRHAGIPGLRLVPGTEEFRPLL